MKLKKWQIAALIALLVFLMGVWGGYALRKARYVCPTPTNTTVFITDTVVHNIPTYVPYYIIKKDSIVWRDTVLIPQPVDTAKILASYFAKHYYTREWTDDTILYVKQRDMVTENIIYPQEFEYKILRPQTINNTTYNSTTYNSYLTGGLSTYLNKPNDISLDVRYVMPKWYIGGMYMPSTKAYGISIGATIFKFKKTN